MLDEPTTGLHMSDIGRLHTIINRLVDAGNTVVTIEHNQEVIRQAGKSALQVSLEHGLLRQTATNSKQRKVALRG